MQGVVVQGVQQSKERHTVVSEEFVIVFFQIYGEVGKWGLLMK